MSEQKVKYLAVTINRNKGEQVTESCRPCQLYSTYDIFALGTAGSNLPDYLGISETDKELLFCCLPAQLEHEAMHRIAKEIQIRRIGHGIMFTVPPSRVSSLFQRRISCGGTYEEEEMEREEYRYELVIAAVEHGWHDQVMEAAKGADAVDGMVFRVRSLHEDDATSFLGIRLQDERDIVVILSVYESHKQTVHGISMATDPQTEVKGLTFPMSVDEFIRM